MRPATAEHRSIGPEGRGCGFVDCPGYVLSEGKETMTTQVIDTDATFEAVQTLSPAIVARSEEIERTAGAAGSG